MFFSQFSLTSHFVKLTRNGLLIKVQSQNTSAGKSVLGKLLAPFVLFLPGIGKNPRAAAVLFVY